MAELSRSKQLTDDPYKMTSVKKKTNKFYYVFFFWVRFNFGFSILYMKSNEIDLDAGKAQMMICNSNAHDVKIAARRGCLLFKGY